jgi:uncharacterized protein YdeI (YjbR/CyaY-like superfamily)
MKPATVKFFPTARAFRRWLTAQHGRATELWVGFHRKGTGLGGITYSEALDEALCFGWIDSIRRKLDAVSYTNRFTPRTARSVWSLVNARRAEELQRLGRMKPSGLRAFAARHSAKTVPPEPSRRRQSFAREQWREFRANAGGWNFFRQQPLSYQRLAHAWVLGAKRAATRQKRFAKVMTDSSAGRRVAVAAAKPQELATPVKG